MNFRWGGQRRGVFTQYEVGSFLERQQVRAQQAFPTACLQAMLAACALGPLGSLSLGRPEQTGPGEKLVSHPWLPQGCVASFPEVTQPQFACNSSLQTSHMALVIKSLPANTGDMRDTGWIPGSGRSPGGGNGNPLRYSCPKDPMDRGAWQAAVHGITKSRTS